MKSNRLNLGEQALIESITGCSLNDENQPTGKLLAAQVLVIKKREVLRRIAGGEKGVKAFTLEDAYAMDVMEAYELIADFTNDKELKKVVAELKAQEASDEGDTSDDE